MNKILKIAAFAVFALALVAGASSASAAITSDLSLGSTGAQVSELQATLVSGGYLAAGLPSGYFGQLTKAAVMKWQAAVGINPATGYFGPISRGKLAMMGSSNDNSSSNNNSSSNSNNDLEGGAGDITLSALSTYGNEEVGEGEEDVKVLSLDVEADDSSDVQLTSIKVELAQQTVADSQDLEDYVDSVSIWLDGKEIGSADADSFSENGDVYTKSIKLKNAVIDADEELELVVAVSALNNLDSGDINSDDWQVGVSSIRFVDGDGVSTTESVTLDVNDDTVDETHEEAFNFTAFAAAADVELKVALGDDDDADEINEAHVINVDTTDDNDDVEVLAFTIEAEGDSDIEVKEIPVLFTTTGETDEAVILNTARLWLDGEVIATDDVPTGGAVVFEDTDFTIEAGEEVELKVTVDVEDLPGGLDVGDTVKAELTNTEVDAIDAEDESGEDVDTGDLTGTALGEASEFRDVGIMVKLKDKSAVKSNGEQAVNSDSGLFTIKFDVTAFDGDAFIDLTAPDASGGATESDIDMTGAGTLLCSIDTTSGATEGTDGFEVEEDATETFEVTCDVRDGGTDMVDGFFDIALKNILYALTDVDGDIVYNFNMEDFKTGQIFLDDRE